MNVLGQRYRLVLLGLVVAVVTIPLIAFGSALIDDAYITFGAARQLASGNLGNYNGDPIEQSSSPLHVLILAIAHRLTGVAFPTVGFVAGLLFAAATVVATWVMSVRAGASSAQTLFAAAIVASSVPVTYWAIGGLETLMVATLVAVAVAALSSGRGMTSHVVAAVALCLLTAARPEGFIVVLLGLSLTTILRANFGGVRALIPVWAAVVVAVAVQFVVRWSITGHLLPNTVRAKARGVDIVRGVKYLATTLDRVSSIALAGLFIAAAAGAVAGWRARDERRLIVVSWAAVGLGVALLAGGDWMPGGRFLAPWIPLLAVLACSTSVGVRRVAPAMVVLQLVGTMVFVQSDSNGSAVGSSITSRGQQPIPLVESRSVGVRRDLQTVPMLVEVVRDLNDAIGHVVTVSSGQAGISAFYLFGSDVDATFIDRFQLSTRDFDDCSDLLQKSVYGAAMSYPAWLANEERCGVPAPDVVFELGSFADFPELTERYSLVFEQRDADLTVAPPWSTGPVRNAQFIAVRSDLL